MREEFKPLIEKFYSTKVLVVGDTIIDKSTYGKAEGLSLESPTLKATFQRETVSFGGAANLVRNLNRLGVKVTFITACKDTTAATMMRDNGAWPVRVYNAPVAVENVKQRFYISHGNEIYKYFQLNSTTDRDITEDYAQYLVRSVEKDYVNYDVVAFSDYNCGFINASVRQAFFELAKKKGSKIYAAAQVSGAKNNLFHYQTADCVVMNEAESHTFKPSCPCYITEGANGSVYKIHNATYRADAIRVTDVKNLIGAGDAFFAAVVAGHTEPVLANKFANAWAGAYIQKPFGELPWPTDPDL